MKKYLLFLSALAAYGQTVSLSDTLTNAVGGGSYTGRVTVTLNAPGNASPLYYSTTSLTGWQAVYCIGVTGADCTTTTSAGTFAATLYANSTITPAGTSYSARFQPAKGAAWSEVWTVEAADTKLYQVRSTTVPSPTVMFQPSQLTAGGASNGSCLVFDGTVWEPAACASGGGSGTVTSVAATVPSILAVTGSPITSSGTLAFSLATQTANQVFAGPTSGGAATPAFRALVAADIPANAANTSGNAATATALASNPTNCSPGNYPLGIDASGNVESCTAAGGGSGTVTTVSVTTANGVSGSVANATTTPAITLTLGAITPSSVAAVGTVTGSNLSGTNTGDQTTITGNAGTATALAANGANCSAGTLPRGVDASGAGEGCAAVALASEVTGTLANSSTTATALNTASAIVARDGSGNFAAGTITAALTGNASTSTALAANGANCSAGSFPLGVDASGASETCTALPTTISGTANEITASASTGAVTLSLPSTVNLSSKTLRVPNGIFLPGACTVGDAYMDTDATTGSRWYLCESTNTWVVQGAASGGSVLRTTYASLPACGGSNTNYQYVLTDSIYSAQCNGSSYAYWSGQKYIPTLPWSNGTTFGTGATVTATTGSVLFDAGSPTGGDSIRAALKAIPTAPYTIILDFDMSQAGAVGSSSCGLVITDGTTAASNKVITLMQSYIGLNMTKLTNATTWNSNYIAYAQATSRNKFSLRLVDDNTNRTWSASTDRINWTQVSQQSRTDFLTASHYGYGCNMTGVSGYVTMVVEGLYAQ
jgi:hypothetical protein